MSIKIGKKYNHEFYIKNLNKYGIHPLSVHWQSSFTQNKRFEVLTNFIKTDITNSSIIDAGCGLGDYYKYLEEKKLLPLSYKGFDMEEKMIELAKKRFKETSFEVKDIIDEPLEEADYYICSGALNILNKEETFLFIDKCFKASSKAFIFNFLKKEHSFNRISMGEVLGYCKKLSLEIKINSNYLENDVSIYLSKQT